MCKLSSCVLALVMLMTCAVAYAQDTSALAAGSYTVSAELSCYVNAMGGVEFSNGYGLLKSTSVEVDESGNASATLELGTTSGLSVYGVACTAFIGADEAPGYYVNGEHTSENVTYTVSEDTVTNSKGEVNYITSITMPVDANTSEYTLWVYLDSNVMGCQLGDGTGSGSSNTPGVATKHTAKLTIDWSSAKKIATADETKSSVSNVEYNVEGGYEVEIPATINVDSATGKGTYSVTAKNFVIADGAYVTVSADKNGKLTNGSDELAFTNALEDAKLTKSGDSLSGTIEVTDSAKNPGKYTGVVNFTVSYFSGK